MGSTYKINVLFQLNFFFFCQSQIQLLCGWERERKAVQKGNLYLTVSPRCR